MKRIVTLLFLCLTTSIFSQNLNQKVVDENGRAKLLGKINKEGLSEAPFNEWFDNNYEAYLTNEAIIKLLKTNLKDYEIKLFLGTWCGDSKREVPRFYKILEQTNFPKKNLEVIALDNVTEHYKQSPNGEEKGLNIHRVPTFIFYKDGKEVSRIVEEPVETLERDMLHITSGMRYRPKYIAATRLGEIVHEKPLDSLNNQTNQLRDLFADYVKHSGELNTLGYVLLRAKELEKALLVFKINQAIFPYKPNTTDSYAEALFEKKDYEEALKNYYKILSLNPEDENAMGMVNTIKNVRRGHKKPE